jgi:BCD family chlorophyll transporter-like MFS transporter
MLLGGLRLIPRYGKPRITAVGVGLQVAAFALLAWASAAEQAAWVAPGILGLGLGAGLFTVGGVALMMDMTAAEHTGLFVGAWTLIQATAKGPASIAGGALVQTIMNAGATAGQAYGAAFALEGLGLLASLYCLARVGVRSFQREVADFGALVAEAGD